LVFSDSAFVGAAIDLFSCFVLDLMGGFNTYGYVYGNPNSFIDPSGNVGLPGAIVGGVAGGIFGVVGAIQSGSSPFVGGATGFATGAVVGGLGFTPASAGIAAWVGGSVNAIFNIAGQGIEKPGASIDAASVAGAFVGGAVGGGLSAIGGPLANAFSRPVSEAASGIISTLTDLNIQRLFGQAAQPVPQFCRR
jgi:hypothetical protein